MNNLGGKVLINGIWLDRVCWMGGTRPTNNPTELELKIRKQYYKEYLIMYKNINKEFPQPEQKELYKNWSRYDAHATYRHHIGMQS